MKSNRALLTKFIILIGLLSFVSVVGYNFITEGIQDAVIFTPVVDDFMWGILCSLFGVVSFAIAWKSKSVSGKLWHAVKGIFFLVSGLAMLFNGIQALS
ncbi:hypothetical protein BIY21_18830 [Vibrio ponticus]|uniref:Uncharacterized protein n=1 Tax=Vibrio ponticus TaxID=265668 RepID=A0ABX3F6Z8_9VIBR|nr:hypothetical protein [Vibrio ponticus]OLQ85686.1 hypothetical protein BIY21_18830 [Vibrio ponticus]